MTMTQRTLYKTIEKIGLIDYASEEEMLIAILREFVSNDRINIIGGRIWQLRQETRTYRLVYEQGTIEEVGVGFEIALKDYEVFDQVARSRTVLADETNRTLRKKGIKRYSATGMGGTVRIGRTAYYEYLMAFNTVVSDEELRYTMNIVAQAVTQLLERRRSEAEKRILENELEHAAELQRQILPAHEYQFGRYELYGISMPERTVGGDFFNYYTTPGDSDRLGVAVGDAASKGFPAAVQALFVSGALMMSVEYESKISSAIRRINTINRKIFPDDRLLSLFYCELFDVKDGLLLYANAGHPAPIHYHAATRSCSSLTVTGPIIGLLPDATFTVAGINLAKNDILLLYTDGITEANNGSEEYGEQRLADMLAARADKPAKTICAEIVQDAQIFGTHGVYADDKTVVVIKRLR
ncbi:MAG: PP2C family protein-serine/threonine phosphatase [Ignavibacteriae bacterium]|nr:PP2C family protein-serine/threonine phosphatase [Ignavibacteriota bacterium]